MTQHKLSRGRRAVFYLAMVLITTTFVITVGELVVRTFRPVPYMHPRYKYSPAYGFELYESTRMVHAWPGRFKFHYTVNELGYRGKAVTPAQARGKPTVVVLGDSWSFGMGVDDGEPYADVMAEGLGSDYNVVNFGIPGWGLTQQIRRYVEVGRQYEPEYVVLQYCANDPQDNINNMVTTIANGEFQFSESSSGVNQVKKVLSRSIIQKSQMYNLVRDRLYKFFQSRHAAGQVIALGSEGGESDQPLRQERFYCELLERFARLLDDDGARLILISVDGQLKQFDHIDACVAELADAGAFEYLEVRDWVEGVAQRKSAEGHWGPGSHRAIGQGIGRHITSLPRTED